MERAEEQTEYWQPNRNAGRRYCRKIQEVTAIQVTRENIDRVRDFTGGGTLKLPRTPGWAGTYIFLTDNGTYMRVTEGRILIRNAAGYDSITPKEFAEMYEPNDGGALELFSDSFGTNIGSRCRKLSEEYGELMEVLHNADKLGDKEFVEQFIDELADLNAVVYHIAGILGKTQADLLAMAVDKVKGRMIDPNYKRLHPHKGNF